MSVLVQSFWVVFVFISLRYVHKRRFAGFKIDICLAIVGTGSKFLNFNYEEKVNRDPTYC